MGLAVGHLQTCSHTQLAAPLGDSTVPKALGGHLLPGAGHRGQGVAGKGGEIRILFLFLWLNYLHIFLKQN